MTDKRSNDAKIALHWKIISDLVQAIEMSRGIYARKLVYKLSVPFYDVCVRKGKKYWGIFCSKFRGQYYSGALTCQENTPF